VNPNVCLKATTSGVTCMAPGGGLCPFCINDGHPATTPSSCYGNGAVCSP
jgi:hypothetical protein